MTAPAIKYTDRVPDATILGTDVHGATDMNDALDIAGLNWGLTVTDASELTIMGADGVTMTGMPGRRFISRDDTGEILAAVGNRYTPITNREAFALADHAKNLGAQFAAAGSIDHGRTVFMSMEIPEATGHIAGVDPVDFGFYLRSGHDGESATYSVSARRRWCTNGSEVGSLAATPRSWSIRHTSSAQENLILARQAVAGAIAYAKAFVAHAEAMATTPMTTAEFMQVLDIMAPKPDEERKAAVTRWEKRRDMLLDLWANADTQEEIRGTRWAAFNSITEYLDWYAPTKGEDPTRARALRQFNDAGAATRRRAFDLLVA